jgi:two-component system response regulator DegU
MDDSSQSAKMKPIKIVVVDDHAVVRQGTRNMLTQMPGIEVLAECADGADLLALLEKELPDLILLDINLPGKNGLQLLAELKPKLPGVKIVLFSAHTEPQYIARAKQLQADGYWSKTITERELQAAIMQVMHQPEQDWVLSEDVAQAFESTLQEKPKANLTARELEILAHLGKGLTNQAIAKTLCLAVKTVDTHVASLIKKTGVRNRTQLLAYAYEHQLL